MEREMGREGERESLAASIASTTLGAEGIFVPWERTGEQRSIHAGIYDESMTVVWQVYDRPMTGV